MKGDGKENPSKEEVCSGDEESLLVHPDQLN